MSPISYRPATREDVPDILAMIQDLAVYEKLRHECVATEADLARWLFDEPCGVSVLIAASGRDIVGFALWFLSFSTFLGRPGIYLEDLYVRENFRNQGIGQGFIEELIRIGQVKGYGRLEWSVLDWNAPSIAFYERLGARVREGWLVMRIPLDPSPATPILAA